MTEESGTYQLIDFGNGRKLESLAGYVIDRPSPAADFDQPEDRRLWNDVDARFDGATKRWEFRRPWPKSLVIDCDGFIMPTRPTPFGHIGLFPEQADNWQWLRGQPKSYSDVASHEPHPKGLNLFGYTGASSMAMLSAGFEVAHVDAAKPNVDAAAKAAELNNWQDRPIRYLVDDAAKFVAREVRRERHYHTVVLDPPAYGHSPKQSRGSTKTWRLERDLWPLLDNVLRILDPSSDVSPRILFTGHTESIGPDEVIGFLKQSRLIDTSGLRIDASRSQLRTASGRELDAGFQVRCVFER
ncbi:class I SAM-dependent methyltransferase [Rubripirellula obstinata]|nr:class I SAM-dependent methyltransferase [Rubripirellula obstinata]